MKSGLLNKALLSDNFSGTSCLQNCRKARRYVEEHSVMNKYIFSILFLLVSSNSLACQYDYNSYQLENALADRQSMRNSAFKLAEEAETIFLAYLDTFDESSIQFYDVVNLKGVSPEGIKLAYSDPQEIIVGCGGKHDYSVLNVPVNGEPGPYLVYSNSGVLTRIKYTGSFAPAPSGHEEIEWLMQQQHITSQFSSQPSAAGTSQSDAPN